MKNRIESIIGVVLWRWVRRFLRAQLAHREAVHLAQVIWRRTYQDASPNWQPLDDTAGVISQIDNMHAGALEENEKLRAALEWCLSKEPSPCRCMSFAKPPHVCVAHRALLPNNPVSNAEPKS